MKGIVYRGLLAVAPVLLGIGCRAERMTQPPLGSVVTSASVGPAAAVQGTVWAWGDNAAGSLGNGTNTMSNTPVEASGLTGVTALAGGFLHSLALKSDGTVWAWGDNFAGELGNGTQTNSNTPVQVLSPGGVGSLTGVTALAVGGANSHSLSL